MNAQHREAWDELARSINQLILEEPFYGHLFSSVIRDITPTTPTMAVGVEGARIALQVNPEFLLNLTFHRGNKKYRSERVAVIKHEALHLVFKHIFRRENREPRMYNLAADIVVNQFVKPWKLPEGGITLETFPDLELEPDQTLDWYYGKLQELSRKPQSAPQSSEVLGRLLSQEDATIVGDPASGLMR